MTHTEASANVPTTYMIDTYRQRFIEYHAQSQREHYLFITGRKAKDESRHWLAEFSDLFTREAVAGLRAAYEGTSADRPNARAAVGKLWQFAEIGRSRLAVRELDEAVKCYEREVTVSYREDALNVAQAESKAWHEVNPRVRREWSLRLADLVRGGDDLRGERLRKLHDYAVAAGYANYATLLGERRGVAYGEIESQITLLLMLTERDYRNALAAWLPAAAGVSKDESDVCDVEFARRHHRPVGHDAYFNLSRAREVLESLFEGLGFAFEQQTNCQLETPATLRNGEAAACFALHVPDDVKLCVALDARHSGFAFGEFLRATGAAQQAAWTSREQLYEFRVPIGEDDAALAMAWGYLFESLLQDSAFLIRHLGFGDSAAFRHQRAVSALYGLRRDAALWLYEWELYSGKFEDARQSFTELINDGLMLRVNDAEHLRAVAEPLHSGDRLRARAFAAQLGEHLKTQFGSRWWAARKAGELLIDLWNTGHRYTVEELAAQIGFGKLSYDWLATSSMSELASH